MGLAAGERAVLERFSSFSPSRVCKYCRPSPARAFRAVRRGGRKTVYSIIDRRRRRLSRVPPTAPGSRAAPHRRPPRRYRRYARAAFACTTAHGQCSWTAVSRPSSSVAAARTVLARTDRTKTAHTHTHTTYRGKCDRLPFSYRANVFYFLNFNRSARLQRRVAALAPPPPGPNHFSSVRLVGIVSVRGEARL